VEWIEYTTVAEDSGGSLVRFTWPSVPGGRITGHIHPNQQVRFTIGSGEVASTLDGEQRIATAGGPSSCPRRPPLGGEPRIGGDGATWTAKPSSNGCWATPCHGRSYSIGRLEIPDGSRPASSQPTMVAATGMAITMRNRLLQGCDR